MRYGSTQKFTAVVVGAGTMGQHHVRVLRAHPAVSDVLVCDPDPVRRSDMVNRFGTAGFATLDEVLEFRPDTHLAVIATPTDDHFETTARLLSRGIACLVEKPIAHSLDSACQLAELAATTGTLLAVGHVERYNPAVIRLRSLLLDGTLGEVKVLNARRAGPPPDPSRAAMTDVLVDIGIHEVDVCRFILGREPSRFFAVGGSTYPDRAVTNYASLLMDFDGICGQVQVDWLTPHKTRRLEVMGTLAMATLEYVTQDLTISYPSDAPLRAEDFPQILLASAKKTHTKQVDIQGAEPLFIEISEFLHALQGGGDHTVHASDAIESLRVSLAATEAIRAAMADR